MAPFHELPIENEMNVTSTKSGHYGTQHNKHGITIWQYDLRGHLAWYKVGKVGKVCIRGNCGQSETGIRPDTRLVIN